MEDFSYGELLRIFGPLVAMAFFWLLSRKQRELPKAGGRPEEEGEVVPPYPESEPPPKPELPGKPERKSERLDDILREYTAPYDPSKARSKNELAERFERAAAQQRISDEGRYKAMSGQGKSIRSAPYAYESGKETPAQRIRRKMRDPENMRDAFVMGEIFKRKEF